MLAQIPIHPFAYLYCSYKFDIYKKFTKSPKYLLKFNVPIIPLTQVKIVQKQLDSASHLHVSMVTASMLLQTLFFVSVTRALQVGNIFFSLSYNSNFICCNNGMNFCFTKTVILDDYCTVCHILRFFKNRFCKIQKLDFQITHVLIELMYIL